MNAPILELDASSLGRQFDSIYRKHYRFVRATLSRFGVPAQSLDDVAQIVFISVYRNLNKLDPGASITAFLYGFARGIAANERKKNYREDRKRRALGWAKVTPWGDGQVERLAAQHTAAKLLTMVSEDQREAFVLHELWGMSAPEIAGLLSANANTVRSRIRAARTTFRRRLAEILGTESDAAPVKPWLELLVERDDEVVEARERGHMAILAALAAGVPAVFQGGPELAGGGSAPTTTTGVAATGGKLWAFASAAGLALAALTGGAAVVDEPAETLAVASPELSAVAKATAASAQPGWGHTVPQFIDLVDLAKDIPSVETWASRAQNPSDVQPAPAGQGTAVDDEERKRRWIVQRIADARHSVRAGLPIAALMALNKLDRRFPTHDHAHTALRWRVEALCQQGEVATIRALVKAEAKKPGGLPPQLHYALDACEGYER